tara:strand:- start:193 stop:1017 length:825 start_codon:yes stop_codon:yes gene_type:complete
MSVKIIFDKETLNKIIKEYKSDKKVKDICESFSFSKPVLLRILKENNIELRSNKIYKENSDYFSKIDNPHKSYWLGFLYADGYVRKRKNSSELKLKLSIKDKEHLYKFRNSLDSNAVIKDGESVLVVDGREYRSKCSFISIYNPKIVDDLFNKGCVNKKTLTIEFPKWLDNDLKRHFIRGYFDGDGSIVENKTYSGIRINFCSGSYSFIEELDNFLHKILNVSKTKLIRYEKTNSNYLQYNKQSDVFKVLDYMYNDVKISLDRKNKIYNEYRNI